MKTKHPVAMYRLSKGDEGYSKGARIRLDNVDKSEEYYFRTQAAAEKFIFEHGMKHIDEDEMISLRQKFKEKE